MVLVDRLVLHLFEHGSGASLSVQTFQEHECQYGRGMRCAVSVVVFLQGYLVQHDVLWGSMSNCRRAIQQSNANVPRS